MNLNKIAYKQAMEKAAALCSRKECCKSDVKTSLARWGANPDDMEKIIEELGKGKYIDEARYAGAFVNDKFKFNQWGKEKIKFQLRGKNIPEKLIQEQLYQIDQEKYESVLRNLLIKKQKKTFFSNGYEKIGKLIQFAQSRGFEYELAKRIVEEMD